MIDFEKKPVCPLTATICAGYVGQLVHWCFSASYNAGWWHNLKTGQAKAPDEVFCEKLALIHSELSETLEAWRKGTRDQHIPYRTGVEVELADACIRIFDLAGAMGLDLGGAIYDKMHYNARRTDHKVESRLAERGKRI